MLPSLSPSGHTMHKFNVDPVQFQVNPCNFTLQCYLYMGFVLVLANTHTIIIGNCMDGNVMTNTNRKIARGEAEYFLNYCKCNFSLSSIYRHDLLSLSPQVVTTMQFQS